MSNDLKDSLTGNTFKNIFLSFKHVLNMMLKHVVGAGDDGVSAVAGVHSE